MHYVVGYTELPVYEEGNERVTSDTAKECVFGGEVLSGYFCQGREIRTGTSTD